MKKQKKRNSMLRRARKQFNKLIKRRKHRTWWRGKYRRHKKKEVAQMFNRRGF